MKIGWSKNVSVFSISECVWVGELRNSYLNTAAADGEEMKVHPHQQLGSLKMILLLLLGNAVDNDSHSQMA